MRTSDSATAVTRQASLTATPPAPAEPRRGSEYAELSRQVKEAGLLERRSAYYAWKIGITIGLLVAAVLVVALLVVLPALVANRPKQVQRVVLIGL